MLDSSGSVVYAGHSITGYQWTITQGAASASFSGATNGPTVTLLGASPGNVTVQLSVTDSTSATATSTMSIVITAAPVASASSGGGGALDWTWLLGLAAMLLAMLLSHLRKRNAIR